MMDWLASNWGTIVVACAIFALCIGIVLKMLSDRKKGKSSCGHGCASCAMHGQCHQYISK